MNNIKEYIIEKLRIDKNTLINDKKSTLSENEFFNYVKELCKENKFSSLIDADKPVISVNEDTYPYMLLKYYDNRFFSIVENDYVGINEVITIVKGRNNNYIRIPYKGKKLDIVSEGNLRANKYNIDKIFEIFINTINEK